MKAVGFYRPLPIEDPESLVDVEVPKPSPTGRDLLVAVKAVSVNPVDYKRRAARVPIADPPRILGWDAAGVVEATGPDVSGFRPGDAVYYAGSVVRPGANAEYHLVDERIVGRKPRTLDFAQAAALPLTTLTAWEGLFDRMGVSPAGAHAGRRILVIGGAGGVGSIAIQLAKRLARLDVVATASRPESAAWVRALGADHVVDHTKDLPHEVAALGRPEVDYVFCLTHTDHYFPAFAPLVAPQGRICAIVGTQRPVDLAPLMAKSVTFSWELMFTRSTFATPDLGAQRDILDQTAALVEAGTLRTTATTHLGAIDAASLRRAHARLEGGHVIGKIVLEGF